MNKIIQAFVIIGLCSMGFGVRALSDLALVGSYKNPLNEGKPIRETGKFVIENIPDKSISTPLSAKDSLRTKDSSEVKQTLGHNQKLGSKWY